MKARNMALCALFAALTAVCAWLSVPVWDVAYTLQSFAVALALLLLGGKRGTLAVGLYLLLGAVGLPVFSGFQGGFGVLLGATGGYLSGFFLWALVYWLITAIRPNCRWVSLAGLVLGLTVCYAFGSAWYSRLYMGGSALGVVILKCVVPYLVPDGIKLGLAWVLHRRLKRFVY